MSDDPAFPTAPQAALGITRREYFAGCALTGLLAAGETVDDAVTLATAAADQVITELGGTP
jgi:bifunctional ADP-heptose synthase (sugar kinase/adenylyltransferase)